MTREMTREYAMCKLISRGETSKERCSDKTRGKEDDGGEIHAEITRNIIVVEETGRPGRHFDAWRVNASASTDQKEIHSRGSQKSAVPKKKVRRLPLSCEVRGRRRESARPLTPVSGVAASAIRSTRNGENPIEGSPDKDRTRVLGERKEKEQREKTRAHLAKEKRKGIGRHARDERNMKSAA